MKLERTTEGIIHSSRIDWKSAEKICSRLFPSRTGRPTLPLRIAPGTLIIQKRMKLSDRVLVKFIAENPYCQYILSLEKFAPVCPFKSAVLGAKLFGIPAFFLFFYFMEDEEVLEKYHCMEFCG